MESLPVVAVVVTLCAVVYTVYIHAQEVAALETRLQQLETLPLPAPQKHRKLAETHQPAPIRSLPAPRPEERAVEYTERGMETDPLPEESRKRTRADSQTSDREEIRRKAIGNNGKNRQDKAAAYFHSNFQRSKERFMASVGDLAKKPKLESKYESPKAGRSETLTYTSPSEAHTALRTEPLEPPPHKEEKTGGLFGAVPQQPAGGSLFGAKPAPVAVDSSAEKPSVSAQQPSSVSLFGASAPSSTPPTTTGASLFSGFSTPNPAPIQPASTSVTPAQPSMNPDLPTTSLAQPSASPGSSTTPAQTPGDMLGGTSLFGTSAMGQAAPKPPSLVQAPPPATGQLISLFGAPVTAPEKPAETQSKSLFGTSTGNIPGATATTAASLFATPKVSSEAPHPPASLIPPAEAAKSVFPPTSAPSFFPAATENTAIPQFGSSSTSSAQTPLFGLTSQPPATGTLFGNMPSSASSSSLFGSSSKPAEGGMTSSLFGTLPPGFSQPAQGAAPVFGSGASSLFGGAPSGASFFPTPNSKT